MSMGHVHDHCCAHGPSRRQLLGGIAVLSGALALPRPAPAEDLDPAPRRIAVGEAYPPFKTWRCRKN
jgi:hypothetical protein